jgi:hypothetical protein
MTFAEMIKRLVPIAASSGLEDPPRGLGDYGLKGGGARSGVFLEPFSLRCSPRSVDLAKIWAKRPAVAATQK